MKSKMVIYFISLLFILTVLSEIILLNRHFDLQKQFSVLEKMQPILILAQRELELKEAEQQWRGLPLYREGAAGIEQRYLLLFFFSSGDCGSCVEDEIELLNRLADQWDNRQCRIMALTGDGSSAEELRQLARIYRIRFDMAGTDSPFFNPQYDPDGRSPLLLFGDAQNNRVLYAFYSRPGRKAYDHFMPAVERFLHSL